MKADQTKLYTSAESYLKGPEGMRNEVTMWYVASGIFIQEVMRQQRGSFGGLFDNIGAKVRTALKTVKVLDVCCGPGNFVNYLSLIYQKLDVTGVDIREIFTQAARERFPEGKFITADATRINLGKRFDFVLASSAYHHIPDEGKIALLTRMQEHLTKNGKVLVCDNFLPKDTSRANAITRYYNALKGYYERGNATPEASCTIDDVRALELAGEEEHKVTFARFKHDVRRAGLEIELDIPVWQPSEFQADNAGSHVLILKQRQS